MDGRGSGFDKQKKGTPRNNKAQNRQSRKVVQKTGLTKDAGSKFHHEISHKNYGYKELLEEAEALKNESVGKQWKRNIKQR